MTSQTKAVTSKKDERESIGVDLYGVQQELARYQMLLEGLHDDVAKMAQDRDAQSAKLNDVRNQYRSQQNNAWDERKKCKHIIAASAFMTCACC